MVISFIDDHKDRFGVEPICRVLSGHGCQIAPSTYYAAKARPASARAIRDAALLVEINRVFHDRELGRGLAGARKVWHLLRRDAGVVDRFGPVARCTVERLMRQAGLQGARRGRGFVTTRPDKSADRPPDRVNRDFTAEAPNRLWIVDFERHEAFANPGGGGRPPLDACRSRRVEAGGRSIASAWGWLVEQSSTTTSRSSTARWGGLG
jgi:putative transposase